MFRTGEIAPFRRPHDAAGASCTPPSSASPRAPETRPNQGKSSHPSVLLPSPHAPLLHASPSRRPAPGNQGKSSQIKASKPSPPAPSLTGLSRAGTVLAGILCSSPAFAQLPTARLDSIFPPGLRAGTDSEITIAGADLEDADRLLFSDAGLSATRVEGPKFKVTASAGLAPGYYEVRAAGRYGISASRLLAVGTFPEVVEPADNHSPDKAPALTLPVTVNGTAGGDAADYFRVRAAKDQRLVISCAAGRVDSPLNAVLSVLDSVGRELQTAHRTRQSEAILNFTAPSEGDYVLKVHDMTWQGGVYRLSIASPEENKSADSHAMPLSGSICDWMPTQPVVERILKPEANAVLDHKLPIPAITTGTGSREWFEFTGSKGRKVMLDLLSHRHGHPSDWVMQVFKITRDDKGQEKSERLAEFDDTSGPPGMESLQFGSRDPSGSITCEEGITYRLQLTDRFNAQKPWHLVLRDPQPGFSLVAFSVSPVTRGGAVHRWSSLLRKGGSALVHIAVLRRDGFDAPVTLRMDDLPAGVTAGEIIVPPGVASAFMVVRAAPDAKTWGGRIKITGTSGDVTATAREAIPRWSVGNTGAERFEMRLSSDGLVLAVNDTEAAPLTVEPAEQKVYESALGGSIEVPVKFNRDASHKGFKGEWEAVLMGLPGMRQALVVKPAADAKDAKLVLDLKRKDGNEFQPGTWTCYATARGTIKWQPGEKTPVKELTDATWSAPIQVKIEPSPVLLTAPASVTVAPGAKVEVPLKIERRYGFAEALTIEFTAPAGTKGLTAEKLTIPKEAGESKLTLTATADAPHGPRESLLNAKCQWNGQEIPWTIKLNVEVKP
jgi:hypothetical protein